ncbi:MAG: phosphoketolase family protein [Bacilli bacterium]
MKRRSELESIDAYFRAVNYLSVAQIYLKDNCLLTRELKKEDIKSKLIGHWGSAPGQNFIYTHLNRVIKNNNLNVVYVSGPGHSGQALISNTYVEGSYTKVYPSITQDAQGIDLLCRRFSFPGGVSSHVSPEVPGSINEGGELGYSLAHAYGCALDNKDLIVACVIGDGEAETATLCASWQINKIMNAAKDGIVLPVLHLNGYKIANPTIMGRMSNDELTNFFYGLGYEPFFVECNSNIMKSHKQMMSIMDKIVCKIKTIKSTIGESKVWYPVLILRSPKGWTGIKEYNGKKIEGSFRSHQVPLPINNEDDIKLLSKWLGSYLPGELFDKDGKVYKYILDTIPSDEYKMGLNPIANGGLLLKKLKVPDFKKYEVKVSNPGNMYAKDMEVLSLYVRDLVKNNPSNFRIFGPDEAASNKLSSVYEVTSKAWSMPILKDDENLGSGGRVIDSILSENVCEGLLEGYILSGRHAFMHSYEAFIRIIDSMISQHAKWLKVSSELLWRSPISSINYVLTSHCWQQDHNGFTHQDPGFLNHIVTKKPDITRIYLPYDANSLLCCFDHIMQTKNYINVIVASKQDSLQWLSMNDTIEHCSKGIGEFKFASNYSNDKLDCILACAGDTPTLEVIAAYSIIKSFTKDLKIKTVSCVDLMKLVPSSVHPHGLTDEAYNELFNTNVPVVFAFHGYPNLIHELCYKRDNHDLLHVHGYIEEGTVTTPFDMRVQNKIDRFHIVLDVLKYTKDFSCKDNIISYCNDMLKKHSLYIRENGVDMEEITSWTFKI